MLNSSFGKYLKINIAGGSHEPEMILKVKNLPDGKKIDMKTLQDFMERRAPGNSEISTSRKEQDLIYIKVDDELTHPQDFETTSNEMTFVIKNENFNSKDYDLALPRPGHSDLPAYLKYGDKVNMSGGGPFSGRMTAMLCIIGGIALQILENYNIKIGAQPLQIGYAKNRPLDPVAPNPSPINQMMIDQINYAKEDKNSIGGIIEVFATGLKAGIGGPMYDGLESYLSYIFYGIPAVKAVEFGNGFTSCQLMGSENNDDIFALTTDGKIITSTNNHGGILGGLSTGMPLIARIGIKPTPSIGKSQQTINLKTGKPEIIKTQGRHDPCIVPRAIPVCEAAMAVGILDEMLYCQEENAVGLDELRIKIDKIDDQLISLLHERMEISKAVAEYKLENKINIENNKREGYILQKAGGDLVAIYEEIFKESKRIQENIFKAARKEDD